jgi:hypothetical protein
LGRMVCWRRIGSFGDNRLRFYAFCFVYIFTLCTKYILCWKPTRYTFSNITYWIMQLNNFLRYFT